MTTRNYTASRRNWIIGMILLFVLVLVVTGTAVPLLGNHKTSDVDALKSDQPALAYPGVTLREWLNGSFNARSFNGTWLSGREILYEDDNGDIQFSADRRYLLLAFNYQRLFRHTYLAQYKIVNLETREETLLRSNGLGALQLALWAPEGNGLVYVYQSNIYYRPEAEIDKDYQITHTGEFGRVYNGVPDWVYEEEIFASNKAMWFSPSGKKLAFGYFDDTFTPIMSIPYYGLPGPRNQYPSVIPVHYPKSGVRNPTVKLFHVDLEAVAKGSNVELVEIKPPAPLANQEAILATVAFPTEDLVSVTWMNRPESGLLPHVQQKHGWVEQFIPPLFSKDGKSFLLILPQKQNDNDYWRHVTLVSEATSPAPKTTALTSGLFVVLEIVSWDEANNQVYYLANTEKDPAQKHLYRVSSAEGLNAVPRCLSCNITSSGGDDDDLESRRDCTYNSAEFSQDSSYYALTCAGPGVPEVTIHDRDSKRIVTWESNRAIAKRIAKKSLPIQKKLRVAVPGGFEARVKMLLPPNADLSGRTKYPMLVYVYGGPDTNEVTDKFNIDWGTYLVTNKSIIYASIDGRGTGLKGNRMMFAVYRSLGTVEIEDQLNVTRTGIWGWSYGGYATGMALAMDLRGTFKCGISVAPVTDWTLYDSIYTERFMGLPNSDDNLLGYNRSLLLNKVANIRNKDYYLIHGTLDDNVHYQQSLFLAKLLEEQDILFQQQTYTDETHDIARSRTHLYHSMGKFLDQCFKLSS
ncbi:unnamed protein product [Trichogramma brassicae]|uniref:Venom dipeptidyl peptidase 4 n=1 Tax=Trichogramma brassicae TaxID=86971 RepID=A0A6H5IXJ9_9HYME|nr:unnamed protein product [Trichogramma brassicae]